MSGCYRKADFDRLMDRITTLRREGKTTVQIADALNREGFSTPRRRGEFSAEIVNQLLKRRGLADGKLGRDWWCQLRRSRPPGWMRIHSRKTPAQRLWIIWADKSELKRLRELAALSHRGVVEYPSELTTPKERR